MRLLLSIVSFSFIFQISFGQQTILVPQDHSTIQGALNNSSQGDKVLVSPGVYFEHVTWPSGLNGVELRSIDGAETTIIDGSQTGRPMTITGFSDIDTSTVFDGFTLRNGRGNAFAQQGGGIFIQNVSLILRNLIVENNVINGDNPQGGGMFLRISKSIIENCIIRDNLLVSEDNGVCGGAGIFLYRSSVEIRNCTIENNEIISDGWAYGGGLYNIESHPMVIGTTISGNVITGEYYSLGAGIRSSLDSGIGLSLIGCTIKGNKSIGERPYGSAISSYHQILNLINTIVYDNESVHSALHIEDHRINIVNSTIARNESGLLVANVTMNIRNSILWENGFSIDVEDLGVTKSIINVDHSLVEEGYFGAGNLHSDPLFESENLLIPSIYSPCLNAGNIDVDFNIDILGNERPYPKGSNPDIGAYEINQNFAHVMSMFYLDENTNGIKEINEEFIAKGSIIVDDETVIMNSRADGIFTPAEMGDLKINYTQQENELWYLTSTPSEYIFEVNQEDFADTIYFGINAAREIKNIEAGIYCPPLRCSRTITMEFSVTNGGTTIEDGILWAQLDSRVSEVNPLIDTDYEVGGRLGWDYLGLLPGATFKRKVSIKVPGVTEIEQGELLDFLAEALSNEIPDCNDVYTYENEVRCSYDPNDKLVNPNREDHLLLIDEDITYTIRFQNVGNDYADDVLVVDTLDSNLDYSTFKLLNSSHPNNLRYTLSSDGILNFDFQQIFLPDSTTNEQGSNGFVMYSIKADSTLAEFAVVENTGHIYFDFNPAIVTNTTSNILVEQLPTVSVLGNYSGMDIKVYPNPTTALVQFSERVDRVEIYDLSGKVIQIEKDVEIVDIGRNVNGTYIVRLLKNDKVMYVKITLIK